MITHYFNFVTSGDGLQEINEMEGFDKAQFVIKQDETRLGRDISYAGGKYGFRIYKNTNREYQFDLIKRNFDLYGYEAVVKYEIHFDEDIIVVGQVDFGETYKSDEVNYIEFSVVEESFITLFKKRLDTTINILSDKDVDGDFIQPLETHRMLYKAKPVVKTSRLKVNEGYEQLAYGNQQEPGFFNPIPVYNGDIGVRDTLSWIDSSAMPNPNTNNYDYSSPPQNFKILRAAENLKDVRIIIDFDIEIRADNTQGLPAPFGVNGIITKSVDGQSIPQFMTTITTGQQFLNSPTLGPAGTGYPTSWRLANTVELYFGDINRTEILYFTLFHRALNKRQMSRTIFHKMETTIISSEIGYNTVIPVVRLYDAMKYCAKSASGNEIEAPRWNKYGEFNDQFITTTSLMRNLLDKPFNLSNKRIIEDYCPEVNADFEIKKNGTVFYGLYEDYYRNEEIMYLDQKPFTDYEININPRHYCNTFKYAYDNYQSQKESEIEGTFDVVHGETERLFPTKSTQNTKEVKVGFDRDVFLIEERRKKAYNLDATASTQDDDNVMLIDGMPLTSPVTYTEQAYLQHIAVTPYILALRNLGDFNWALLGIDVGSNFSITSPHNFDNYTVSMVGTNEIQIIKQGGGAVSHEGIVTRFSYTINPANVRLINRTNEGFSLIDGISDPENFGNLRFTVARNIKNYYNHFLASNCIYSPDKPITTRLYKNNPDLETVYEGDYTLEGGDIVPTNPILSARIIKTTFVCSLKQYNSLQELLRSKRGFIRTLDAEGLPLKGYIKSAEWTAETADPETMDDYYGSLKVVLEEKHNPSIMTVIGALNSLYINSEIVPSHSTYSIEGGKLHIFDGTGKLLFVPVMFNRVTVNGAVPETEQQLGEWMSTIINYI